jgi:hypothetical protein
MTDEAGKGLRALLPVKDKHKLIPRVGKKAEEEEEEEEIEEVVETTAPSGLEEDEGFESGSGEKR